MGNEDIAGQRRALGALAAGLTVLLAVVSCETVDRNVVMLPNVPGVSYIGSKECEQCHQEIYRDFKTASHSRLRSEGPNALNVGCESCHGPGSLHAESGGDTKTPLGFSPGRPQVAPVAQRQPITRPRPAAESCYQCHLDKRGAFQLPSHHPVTEGRMKCGDCHEPHKGQAIKGGATALLTQNMECARCHQAQQGPFVFEHEALREGCTTCHDPHGAVNAKMLTARDSNLCLKCHFQQLSYGRLLIGGADHTLRVQQGSCWTAGCHEAVHGSRVSSSLRF